MAKRSIDIMTIVDSIEDDSIEFYKNVVVGQQVFNATLYEYIFTYISQNVKQCHRLMKVSKEKIIREYAIFFGANEVLESPNQILFNNTHRSYAVIGVQFARQGYDAVYALIKLAAEKIFGEEQFAQNKNHFNLIELARTNFISIQKKDFTGNLQSDLNELDNAGLGYSGDKNANKYILDETLLKLAHLRKDQVEEKYLQTIGVADTLSVKKASEIKAGLVEWGTQLTIVMALEYCINNHIFTLADLIPFAELHSNNSDYEVYEQMKKMLHIDKLLVKLFEGSSLPIQGNLSDREKTRIMSGVLAVIFLSEFAPDDQFVRSYGECLDAFYASDSFSYEIDYRFAVLSYLAVFDIESNTNHHEATDGLFHAEIKIKEPRDKIHFVCENESMRYAKKEVWHIAYEQLISSVIRFFETGEDNDSKQFIRFFIHNVCEKQVLSKSFITRFGILSAESFDRIDPSICIIAIEKLQEYIDFDTLAEFVSIIIKANAGKYICANNHIYSYNDWLRYSLDGTYPMEQIDKDSIGNLYDKIVNPSEWLQKRIIIEDYRNVEKIFPLSDDIAQFALEKNIDAYNYFQNTSSFVEKHYSQLLEAEAELLDIGSLSVDFGENVRVTIMDSHKPFHSQLKQMLSGIDLKKISIACGYCFASGLSLVDDLLQRELMAGVPFELFVGSLQKYDGYDSGSLITGIDKATVRVLNRFLSFQNFSLYTCSDRFYHGKLYLFEGNQDYLVIVGSSNISKSAFMSNYELNIAFQGKNKRELLDGFSKWIDQLRFFSKRLDDLDEAAFGTSEMKMDGSALVKHVSSTAMLRKIRDLTDAEIQYRLNLWMSYSPDVIAEDLGILSLPNYFVFVFNEEGLIVLESFEAGNAYYCIKSEEPFESIINTISTFSKTEIFEYSQMGKRGYHVSNKLTLESNIKKYFRSKK